MKKYKLLKDNYSSPYKVGEIYDENYKRSEHHLSVSKLAKTYPQDWELVEDEFFLPENWYINITDENIDIVNKWWKMDRTYSLDASFLCGIYKNDRGRDCFRKGYNDKGIIKGNYYDFGTEINTEQFKKYVLKMEEKEIIGYKLKDKANEKVLRKALGFTEDYSPLFFIRGHVAGSLPLKVKELGVFDWLEPVYEEKPKIPQITINDYKGEFFDNYVKFGCAEINKEVFITLNKLRQSLNCDTAISYSTHTNRSIESVTIGKGTFSKEQIKKIAEYYLNKKI